MSAERSEVNTRKLRPGTRGLSRHLEGWQPALVAVVIAAACALLVVPRPAGADTIPLPHVDAAEASRAEVRREQQARAALSEPLPFLVRAAGESLRSFGRAEAEGRTGEAARALLELRGLARNSLTKHGDEPVLRLLAYQTELFLSAVESWEAGGPEVSDIAELGGAFLHKARAARWTRGERRLVATRAERAALFKVRWVEAAGLRAVGAFAPTANELRIYYRFLLEHPDTTRSAEEPLRYVSAVEKVDLGYPVLFARGVIYYRTGQFARAAQAFRAHLEKQPNGPWRLRAQNHLLAAAQQARETTPDP